MAKLPAMLQPDPTDGFKFTTENVWNLAEDALTHVEAFGELLKHRGPERRDAVVEAIRVAGQFHVLLQVAVREWDVEDAAADWLDLNGDGVASFPWKTTPSRGWSDLKGIADRVRVVAEIRGWRKTLAAASPADPLAAAATEPRPTDDGENMVERAIRRLLPAADGLACGQVEPADPVTLNQMAAICRVTKRTIERWQQQAKDWPLPAVEGKRGRSHEYDWRAVVPILRRNTNRPLPDRFPWGG